MPKSHRRDVPSRRASTIAIAAARLGRVRQRSAKRAARDAAERHAARAHIPIEPPSGLRVFRSVVQGTEYAVLVMPTRERNAKALDLTSAERRIIEMVVLGLSNEAIAARRGTSARTVANQLQSIYAKLGISSRLELTACGEGLRHRC
jgi:DNA-binding NarL/FixJ family response regulator